MRYLVVARKRTIFLVRLGQKNLSLTIIVCHHLASLVMPIGDPQDRLFYLVLELMMDSYSICFMCVSVCVLTSLCYDIMVWSKIYACIISWSYLIAFILFFADVTVFFCGCIVAGVVFVCFCVVFNWGGICVNFIFFFVCFAKHLVSINHWMTLL